MALTIARAAEASIGHQYVWGGIPGPRGLGGWDCSSAVNFWVAVEAGQAIPDFPAGTYHGQDHGPTTLSWLAWIGLGVAEIARSMVQAGDIMCWPTHMGVAVDNTDMISALNPAQGTQRTGIDGLIPGEQLHPLRLKSVDPSLTGLGVVVLQGSRHVEADARAIARTTRHLVAAQLAANSIGINGWRPR